MTAGLQGSEASRRIEKNRRTPYTPGILSKSGNDYCLCWRYAKFNGRRNKLAHVSIHRIPFALSPLFGRHWLNGGYQKILPLLAWIAQTIQQGWRAADSLTQYSALGALAPCSYGKAFGPLSVGCGGDRRGPFGRSGAPPCAPAASTATGSLQTGLRYWKWFSPFATVPPSKSAPAFIN